MKGKTILRSVSAQLRALRGWIDRWQPPESAVLSVAAVVVGLLAGAGVWLFKRLIDLAHLAAFGGLGGLLRGLGPWTVALVPMAGGLVVGLIMQYFVGPERHHGVAGIIESVALAGGRLRYWRMPTKVIGAALAIGAGASVGPEDPSVQIGANLGSMFGQWLRLSDRRVRTLVAAGAAAGIAAAFNAPIAGVFFALEIILGEISSIALGVVVLAAVTSAAFTQAVSGQQPAFLVPPYPFQTVLELPLYLGLGLLAGPVAFLYVRLLYLAQDLFGRLRLPPWARTGLAGLIVGVTGIFLPQIFGVGYDTIGQILGGQITSVALVWGLVLAKLIMTPVSIGGGFPGGVFAPALFLGAALGGGYGAIISRIFPALPAAGPAFAMVGMAALLAGAVHAPLTAVILLFEMTNDYRIILPLMFAVVVSFAISSRLSGDSVYLLGLARKGIRLERGRDVDVLDSITVQEVMHPASDRLCQSDTLVHASEVFAATHHHGLPVIDGAGNLVGIFTLQDLQRAAQDAPDPTRTVGETCTHDLLVAYPDESIGAALRRTGARGVGRLPVVDRRQPRRLLGMLSRADLLRAYDAAVTRRAALRVRAQEVQLGEYSGAHTEEFVVTPGAPCAGKAVRDVPWPRDCMIATIRRRGQIIIPHGDALLQPRDVLVVVLNRAARAEVARLCGAP